MIRAILAHDDQGGIAKNGTLPWPHNTKDLNWFKRNTLDQTVVMGSKTWFAEGMPKPLPNRTNIVISSQDKSLYPGAQVMNYASYKYSWRIRNNDFWIIGGAQLFEDNLDFIEELYLSHIPGDYDCDTFLPLRKIATLFEEVSREEHPECTFKILRRRQ